MGKRAKTNVAGRRGPRGRTGPRGRAGKPGLPANGNLTRLAGQMEHVIKQLEAQVFRIAQLQSQLDRMASGEPAPSERRQRARTN